ncbi:hypothetical protein SUGI_0375350 [Cryptomeria japonica]|uniref:GRAS family protein RAM1-like n=1 Tax=Cryptomeria japonica TaxID=3369 RepID=UPI002408B0EF|nr:GRAS family protein RAM1-like [Cryptomeria japonica]GLJ20608.1 hypothetical protein SUGI_0375350 [Cryptomeria japonica]
MTIQDNLQLYSFDSQLDQQVSPVEFRDYLNHASDARMEFLEYQVYPCTNISEDQIHPSMNNDVLYCQFGEFPSPHNVQTSHELTEVTAGFDNENGLSSEEIIKAAGAQYVHAWAHEGFNLNSHFNVPDQDGVQLVHLLLASAELVSSEQYEEASRMVSQCKNKSSHLGSPIERLCYYFSNALEERIKFQTCPEQEKWKQISPDFTNNFPSDYGKDELYALEALSTRVNPYAIMLQFTAVQAIIDTMGRRNRVHVIDLGIRTGCQWTSLIQSLTQKVSCSLQYLKITAVGMNSHELENSGRRLVEFAKTMAISFSYCPVKISNIEEIHEDLFNVKAGEFVVVYAPIVFRTLLYDPILLGNTINVIKKLKPHILVNSEVEGQHNSPFFASRFVEGLFYYSAYFDCLEVVRPDRNDLRRAKFEEVCCGKEIRNMLACEGKYRRVRHVKMDMWRSFFRQAGFKEKSFSVQAWCQARFLFNHYNPAENFTIEPNGSAITVGWKGTQLHTLSLWSLSRKRNR